MIKNKTCLTDGDVIEMVINGHTDAFEILIHRYKLFLFSIISNHVPRDDIDEVAQTTLIDSYNSLKKCKEPEKFQSWIKQITLRKCYDYWRKKYQKKQIHFESLSHQEDLLEKKGTIKSREDNDIEAEKKEQLKIALRQLNPKEQMLIKLSYQEEYSHKEIAKIMGWTTLNVKVQLHRAKKKLKQKIHNPMLGET